MAQELCVIVSAEDRTRLAAIIDDRNRPLKHIQRANRSVLGGALAGASGGTPRRRELPGGKLIYAGRVGTGMSVAELERVWQRLLPVAIDKMPAIRTAAARQSFRVAARAVAGPLGAAGDGRRGQLRRVDA
jgi:hypothetical protein